MARLGQICNRLVSGLVALAALPVLLSLAAEEAQAQSTLPPFTCSGDIYQVQSGQLRIFDPITSTYTNIGPQQSSYNATGFNIVDNYAYASQGSNIIRIGSDGQVETVFNVGFSTFSGDLDRSNNFYLRRSNNRYERVDLATGARTRLDFSGPGGGPADVAFLPQSGGILIGFSGGQVYRYNLASLRKERLRVTGLPNGTYGATWTDLAGRLFTFNNTSGLLYEVFDYTTGAPFAVQVGVGDPSGNNDGFSCSLASFPNLPPLAQDDAFSTDENVAISGNVTADNGNGTDNDPDGGAIVVSGPDSGPSDGSLILNPDGSFTYTPDVYFLGTDTFTYTVTDPAGLTSTATVTIDVTGDVGFTVDKTRVSGAALITEPGQVINYQIEVENTGDIPLTSINIVDTLPDGSIGALSGPIEGGGTDGLDQPGRIDVGETWTYTISYTSTQADVDGGGPLVNSVSVLTDETGATPQTDTATVPVDQQDSFDFTKSADVASFANVGDPIVFTLSVENTGLVTLTDLEVTDPFFDPALSCSIASLAPGATDTSCSFPYTVTQDDIDRGEVENTATATANGAGGAALPPESSTATVAGPAAAPALRVVKSDENSDGVFGAVGDVETFTFEVFNDGNVTLSNATLSDASLGFSCPLPDIAPGASVTQCADATSLEADLTITQALIDAGSVSNTVNVSAQSPSGATVSGTDTIVIDGPTQAPALSVVKTVSGGDNFTAIGDVITYDFLVTNTGNMTLTAPITVNDSLTSVACPVLPLGGLAPSAAITCTASYSVTQTDLDNGSVVNTATATVTQPTTNPAGTITATSAPDNATASAAPQPAISIAKALDPTSPRSFSATTDVLTFQFTVTNTGNVTLTDAVTVNDPQISTSLACPAAGPVSIAPGDSVSCTATWSPGQPDLDAGSFTNTATATTSFGGSPVTTPTPATETVTATQAPALSLLKTAPDPVPGGYVVGNTITYTYAVTNTGNTTISAPITITDDRIPASGITCPAFPGGGIAPGGSYTCTGDYVITVDDVNIGTVVNNATATDGTTTSPPATESVPSATTPALSITKTLVSVTNPDSSVQAGLDFDQIGDVLTYSFEVENSGTQSFVNPITVQDALIPGGEVVCWVSDPAGGDPDFEPGSTATCTGTYSITQTDLDSGSVVNTAFAQTEFGTIPTIYNSPTASSTANVAGDPELTVVKDVTTGNDPAGVGDVLTYTITAQNTGNQTLRDVRLSDPLIPSLSCVPTGSVTLIPTDVLTCTGTYTVTQADFDAQTLSNTATATGLTPTGAGVSATGTDAHPLATPGPAVTVTKVLTAGSASPAYSAAGDTVSFTITVENSGDVTLDTIDVTDNLVPGTCTVGPLSPGASDDSCVFVYTVQQSDLDNGQFDNIATANATPTPTSGAGAVSDTDTLTVPGPTRAPSISLDKIASPTAVSSVGDSITYTFQITNTGNITLTALPTITDPLLATVTCDPLPGGGLLPNGVTECSGTYAVQQGDLNTGSVTNTATASITNPLDPGTPLTATDSVTVAVNQTPSIALTKTADLTSISAANQTVTYTFTIENTGNVTLTALPSISDPMITTPITCAPLPGGGLVPLATTTCTGTYVTTQADVNAGDLVNIATASIDDPTNPGTPLTATGTATIPGGRAPAVDVVKSSSATGSAAVGEVITYFYTVTNTGNVTLTNLILDDQHTSASGTASLPISSGGVISTLAPGASADLTSTYVVTQADVDAGTDLSNTVTVTTSAPSGVTPPTDAETLNVPVAGPAPSLAVIKDAPGVSSSLTAGDVVTFRVRVQNDGNVSLNSVALTDTLRRADGTLITPAPTPVGPVADTGIAGVLDVGETWEYSVDYTLTQADVDAGGISNQVLATALDPFATSVSDLSDDSSAAEDDPTVVGVVGAPELEAIKVVTAANPVVGGRVAFEIQVENTGNVTLTSVSVLSDTVTRLDGNAAAGALGTASFTGSDAGSPAGTLVPGETATYTIDYTLTQEDLDAGGIANSATVAGTPPSGGPITDVSDNDGIGVDDPTVQTITPAPTITLDKRLASGGPSFDAIGDTLSFAFDVQNTGNVTLTEPITINDPFLTAAGVTAVCPVGPLAPNATLTCTADYTVTQADLDNGSVVNTASAQTSLGGVPVLSPTDTLTVPAQQVPGFALTKTPDPIAPVDFVVGAVVGYTYTITNTGNVTATTPVSITDDRIPAAQSSGEPTPPPGSPGNQIVCPTFPALGLAPGDTYTCTGEYTVTSDDVSITTVVNNATATDGTTTSPPAAASVPSGVAPALSVDKVLTSVANPDTSPQGALEFDQVGDVLTYTFTIENTGTQAFVGDIAVVDPLIPGGQVTCWTPVPVTDPDFQAGETASCTGTYTVTQTDLDNGDVINTAFAQTSFGSIPTVYNSPTDTQTTPAAGAPALDLVKTASGLPVTTVGQTITYNFTLTNTGNQTLSSLDVDDPLLPGLTCSAATLAPGDSLVCSEGYTVTQADIDAGSLINTASASAIAPGGASVTDTDSVSVTPPAAAPAVTLVKTASPTPFGAVGSDVIYTFDVTNTGNVTLSNLVVTDPIDPAYSCSVPTLAPGASSSACTLAYTVTQDDVDAGEINNTASVNGVDPFATPVSATDSLTTSGPTPNPTVELTKTAGAAPLILNGVIPFTFAVENTGTVTLNPPTLVDTMARLDTTPTALDAPPAFQSGDTDGNGLLSVGETWIYTASFTVSQPDINAGGIQNTATASTTDLLGNPASDVSDNGNDGDGNTVDDPTVIAIATAPAIITTKVVTQPGTVAGDEVIFTITGLNTGNVTLTNPTIVDTLTQADGTAVAGAVTAPVLTSGNAAGIDPGESWVWEMRYTLLQDDVNAGGLSNTATAGGTPPSGPVVTDISDNGDPSDGNIVDDPTLLTIARTPSMEVIKTVVTPGSAVGDAVAFDITATNTGNVTLTDLQVAVEDLQNADGASLTPDSVSVISGDTTGVLEVGDSTVFRVNYTLTQFDIDAGGLENSATLQGTSPTGAPISDVSDTGSGTGSTPTPLSIAQIDTLAVTKTASTPTRIAANLVEVEFTMTVENTGNVTQTGMVIEDDLAAFVGPATLIDVDDPVASGFSGGVANAGYDGVTDTLLMTSSTELAPGELGTISVTLRYDIAAGDPASPNVVSVTTDRIASAFTASATVLSAVIEEDLFASKSVTPESALLGETVTYTLTFENRLVTAEANLTFVDDLPDGLAFTPGTARFNGSPTPAPEVIGQQLRWPGITLAPGEVVTITFNARILGGPSGTLVNRSFILGPDGRVVSNIATAELIRRTETLFDCAEIIGRVFDDRNFNGVFDDARSNGGAPREEGLPRVRLVTVDGTLITTDEHGRFSVPCAALPRPGIGSNFQLELDPRTLPSGYFITTENPRVLRVTPGSMTVMNFGAALGQLIEIDLTAEAFDEDGEMTEALEQGIDRLVENIRGTASVLRLSYYRDRETRQSALDRLELIEDALRDRWRGVGNYPLRVETEVYVVQ